MVDIFIERDPDDALRIAEDDWLHQRAWQCSEILVARTAMQGIGEVEALVAKAGKPQELLSYLIPWAPQLGYPELVPILLKHDQVNSYNTTSSYVFQHFKNWSDLASNPGAALTAAQEIPDGLPRRSAITGSLAGWAKTDPHAAAAWVKKQNQHWLTKLALPLIAQAASEAEHPDAETFVVKELGAKQPVKFESDQPLLDGPIAFAKAGLGKRANQMRQKILSRLVKEDPTAAVTLLNTLPHGKDRADLISKFRPIRR